MQPLAKRTQQIKKKMNQDESGAPWRTCSGRVEDEKSKEVKRKKKRGEGGTSLSILRTNQRGEGFLIHAMQEGGARHLRAGEG